MNAVYKKLRNARRAQRKAEATALAKELHLLDLDDEAVARLRQRCLQSLGRLNKRPEPAE